MSHPCVPIRGHLGGSDRLASQALEHHPQAVPSRCLPSERGLPTWETRFTLLDLCQGQPHLDFSFLLKTQPDTDSKLS